MTYMDRGTLDAFNSVIRNIEQLDIELESKAEKHNNGAAKEIVESFKAEFYLGDQLHIVVLEEHGVVIKSTKA